MELVPALELDRIDDRFSSMALEKSSKSPMDTSDYDMYSENNWQGVSAKLDLNVLD